MNTYIHPTLINNARALKTLERRTRSQAIVRSNKLVELMPLPDPQSSLLFRLLEHGLNQHRAQRAQVNSNVTQAQFVPPIKPQAHNATFVSDDGPSAA